MKIKASFLSFFSFFPLKAPGLFAALALAAAASLDAQIIVDSFVYERNGQGTALIKYNGMAATITIPNNIEGMAVTEIGHRVFYGCTGLVNVTIPASVATIGYEAFSGCAGLAIVTVGSGNPAYASVTAIGEHAFFNCDLLTSVTFGAGSSIRSADFAYYGSFPGDLRAAYFAQAGGPGTYTRPSNSSSWIKSQ
ncbi:MAG: leucine-rich repeat domain-containing protein [Spirochaetaceae bacterium]|jgi:hypothetical protein|nr:leucine-rich repeat domain-containing protein [Spirochaetaceae bacterium]